MKFCNFQITSGGGNKMKDEVCRQVAPDGGFAYRLTDPPVGMDLPDWPSRR